MTVDAYIEQEEQGLQSPEKEPSAADSNAAAPGGLATSLRLVGKVKLGQIRGLVASIELKSQDSTETSPPTSRSPRFFKIFEGTVSRDFHLCFYFLMNKHKCASKCHILIRYN